VFLLGCYGCIFQFSRELVIRLGFVKTSEFRGGGGGLNPQTPSPRTPLHTKHNTTHWQTKPLTHRRQVSPFLQATKTLRESRCVAVFCFLGQGARRGWGVRVTPRPLPTPKKDPVPLYRRLGGPQGLSGQAWKISPPPGFDRRIVQPVASRYTEWFTRSTHCCHTCYMTPFYCCSWRLNWSIASSFFGWSKIKCQIQESLCNFLNFN
jgi:hypothetical protein